MKVFIDSDVIISSLISSSGAAFYLLNKRFNFDLYISNHSVNELRIVIKRKGLSENDFSKIIKNVVVYENKYSLEYIKLNFMSYVFDIDDAHIVCSAKEINSDFLVTYNMKDYKIEKIKNEFDIIITKPANFLQYLRSI